VSVAAIMLVKDEVDVIEDVVRHTAGQVDEVIVADNLSTDGTFEVLTRMKEQGAVAELTVDYEVGYYQSRKMSELAKIAGERGASWVVPVDADEVWAARGGRLADRLEEMPPDILLAQAVLYDHVTTGQDNNHRPAIAAMAWRWLLPLPLRKVAARYRDGLTFLPGNHGATYPNVAWPAAALDELVVRHFPYRSVGQFVTKVRNGAAAYAATDLPEDTGAHKRAFGQVLEEQGEEGLAKLFAERFHVDRPRSHPELVHDPLCR
jgi:hypothetical protein